jgi:hypothetical protein
MQGSRNLTTCSTGAPLKNGSATWSTHRPVRVGSGYGVIAESPGNVLLAFDVQK